MESQRTKEIRRAKFLAKIRNKEFNIAINEINKNELFNYNNHFNSHSDQIYSKYQNNNQISNNSFNQQYLRTTNNIFNNNHNNNFKYNINSFNNNYSFQQNNFLNNYNVNKNQNQRNYLNYSNINANYLKEKLEQYDYMINFQSFFKKIILIMLSILHCKKYPFLYNSFIFKYTLFVLEIMSLWFNKYYNDKKKLLIGNSEGRNNSLNFNSLFDSHSQIFINLFVFLKISFFLFTFIKDIIIDFCIVFIINILFFLMYNEEL